MALGCRLKEHGAGWRLAGPSGQHLAVHFLQLNGSGIRDLAQIGEDVLILAGPSMDLDGPFSFHIWRQPASSSNTEPNIEFLFDLPFERDPLVRRVDLVAAAARGYLDEFAFRHNRRKTSGVTRIAARVIEQLVVRPPFTMRELIDDTRWYRKFVPAQPATA